MTRRWFWVPTLALLFPGEARAGITTFSIDPERSVIELQGTVLAFALNLSLNPQAPGSMKVPWGGTLRADVTDNSIRFLGGNWVPVMDSGIWQPDTNGVPGSAPANYGARAANYVSIIVSGYAAFRQMGFDTVSPELPLLNEQFQVKNIQMRFVEAARSAVDYWFSLSNNIGDPDFTFGEAGPQSVLSTVVAAGRTYLQGGITNRATNAARLSVENGVQTLTIPIDARCVFIARAHTGQEFRFSLVLVGQLVAIPGATLECERLATPGAPLRLSWPAGYRLQRAGSLSPWDWSEVPADSPLEVPAHERFEFFRLMRVPP